MNVHLRLVVSSVLAFACIVLPTNLSQGQPESGGTAKVWNYLAKKYDKNSDGKLSQDEYQRGAKPFARLDRNGDGVLTKDDWYMPEKNPKPRRRGVAPKKGAPAPDFELTYVRAPEKTVRLSSFSGKKPVALIFGSCT
jgi:hypothetical protein